MKEKSLKIKKEKKNEEKANEIQHKIWEIEGKIEFYLNDED